jgi:hypothetical protein
MPRILKWSLGAFVLLSLVAVVFSFFREAGEGQASLDLSEVIAAGQDGRLDSIEIAGRRLEVKLRGDVALYESFVGYDTDVTELLLLADVPVGGSDGVRVDHGAASAYDNLGELFLSFVPLLLYPVILYGLYYAVLKGVSKALREDRVREP